MDSCDWVRGKAPNTPLKAVRFMKRNHTIKIRVDDQELDQLKEKYQGKQLAVAMRNAALNNDANRRIVEADPKLLRQLAGLGNNLNQIARQCNSNSIVNSDKIIIELMQIRSALHSLRDENVS